MPHISAMRPLRANGFVSHSFIVGRLRFILKDINDLKLATNRAEIFSQFLMQGRELAHKVGGPRAIFPSETDTQHPR